MDEMWVYIGLAVAVVSALVAMVVTGDKGRGLIQGFFLGLVLGPVGVVIAFLLPERKAANTCPACGKCAPEEAAFCPHCRARLKAGCPKCGESSSSGGRFCAKCGAELELPSGPAGPGVRFGKHLYRPAEGQSGTAPCAGCGDTDEKRHLLFNAESGLYYHKGCLNKAILNA